MKFAAIHKDNKGYIFTPLSKTVAGFLVSTEPVIRIYKHENPFKIATALLDALNASKQNVPNPSFDSITESERVAAKEKLKRLDIKSFNDLNKKPVLYCSVELHEGMITLKPSAHDSNGTGYVNTQKELTVQVNFKAQDSEIVNAIEETFKMCE